MINQDESEGVRRPGFPKITQGRAKGSLPLSVSQKLWIESGLVPHQDRWLPIVWRMDGRLDVPLFARSYGKLTHRHDILRTRLLKRDLGYFQEIDPVQDVRLPLVELQAIAPDRQEYEIHAKLRALLEKGPPLEAGFAHLQLFRLREDLHVLGGFVHNAAMDATSQRLFIHELMEGYFREVERKPDIPARMIQHSDYALWEAQWLTPRRIEEADGIWLARLAEAKPLRLPKGRMYGDSATSWATERMLMPDELHAGALEFASSRRVSLSALFYGALAVALARWSQQDGILFGSVLSARPAGFRGVMGSFTQIRPIFINLKNNPTFGELVSEAGRALIAANDTRSPISPSILQRFSVGNVIVNYARSSEPVGARLAERLAAEGRANAQAPTSRPAASPRPSPPGKMSASSANGRAPSAAANGNGAAPGKARLRCSSAPLPQPLAPEFSRDFYFNMMQASDGVHGLITYSDTRHEKARVRQLADDIFSIMAMIKATPDKRVSTAG
jgi:hypothetical protein